MREWLVAGGVIEGPDGLLLVRNRRRGGEVDWTPPGGVIDEGEALLDGLTREVLEETGILVTEWAGPLYEIHAEAPDLGWHLRVEVHRAARYRGSVVVEDPDGIVDDVCFVDPSRCAEQLSGSHAWVREPLTEWLDERWSRPRRYGYRIEGSELGSLAVTRLSVR